jgi:hypothetical protein
MWLFEVQADYQEIRPLRGKASGARAEVEHASASRQISEEVEHDSQIPGIEVFSACPRNCILFGGSSV